MKRIMTILALAIISLGAFAQPQDGAAPEHKQHHQRFQAEKVAFMTNVMDLTVEEAQAFWPVYNEYSKASDAAHHAMMQALDKVRNKEMTDAEAAQAVDELVAARQKEAEIEAQYTERFKQVLPIKKVAALFAAEEAFRKHLFNQFKDGGPGKPGPGKPGPRRDEPMRQPKDKTQK